MNAPIERMGCRTAFEWSGEIVDQFGNPVGSIPPTKNLIPQGGMSLLIQAPFGDTAPVSAFYVGLMTKNYLPSDATSAADIPTNMGELTSYAEASRPLWDSVFDGVATYDNNASRAQFTATVDATLYGAFLVSEPTKGSANGLVLSVVRFPSPRPLSAGLTLYLTAGLTYIPSSIA